MRAVRMHRTGDPDVLQVDEVPQPRAPVRDELRIRTAASSVNGADLSLRRGGMRVATLGRLPFTLGFDLSGTVERCGPDVTASAPGDPVMALLDHGGGAQADLVTLRQGRAAAAPTSVDLLTAASVLGASESAERAPQRRRDLASGATALTPMRWVLLGCDGAVYLSPTPGTFGGHRRRKVYGRLDCRSARQWLARGHYARHRVFFADEPTARAAGYRPCAVCLPAEYRRWTTSRR